MKNKIKVYCGMSVEDKCDQQLHPINEVLRAKEILDAKTSTTVYSNSTDFILTLFYLGKKSEVDLEFFLDGVSCGNEIEPIFEDLNKAFDLLDAFYCPEKN